MIRKSAINAIFAVLGKKTKITIFIRLTSNVDITIFIIATIIAIITIFAVHNIHSESRNLLKKLMPLIKKGPIEIKILSIRHRVPSVSIPHTLVIHRKRSFFWIERNNLFAREITFAMIKSSIISPMHAPLHPTQRTQTRRRHSTFYPTKDWRNLVIKRKIIIRKSKVDGTSSTIFYHSAHYSIPVYFCKRVARQQKRENHTIKAEKAFKSHIRHGKISVENILQHHHASP
jgi:hypothetical protein